MVQYDVGVLHVFGRRLRVLDQFFFQLVIVVAQLRIDVVVLLAHFLGHLVNSFELGLALLQFTVFHVKPRLQHTNSVDCVFILATLLDGQGLQLITF